MWKCCGILTWHLLSISIYIYILSCLKIQGTNMLIIRVFAAHTPAPHLSASTFFLKIKPSIGSSCYDSGCGWNPIELTFDFTLLVVIYIILLGFWFTQCTFEVLCGFEGGCLAFCLLSHCIFSFLRSCVSLRVGAWFFTRPVILPFHLSFDVFFFALCTRLDLAHSLAFKVNYCICDKLLDSTST
jgi:hypothetical protein